MNLLIATFYFQPAGEDYFAQDSYELHLYRLGEQEQARTGARYMLAMESDPGSAAYWPEEPTISQVREAGIKVFEEEFGSPDDPLTIIR